MNSEPIDEIVKNLRKSSKYMSIDEEYIRSIGKEQLRRRKDLKEAIKYTRSKLHQVGAVYFDGKFDYDNWLINLSTSQKDKTRSLCAKMMLAHASTRERLPFIEEFYEKIFEQLPAPSTIIDIACGLNPLSIPWMNLNPHVTYYAYDIYNDLAMFLNSFFNIQNISGEAFSRDVLIAPPTQQADLALILKAIPCLEQVNSNAGITLLEQIPANNLVVSFPIKSLTGKNKGMLTNYDQHFQSIVEGKDWSISKNVFPTELVYIIKK